MLPTANIIASAGWLFSILIHLCFFDILIVNFITMMACLVLAGGTSVKVWDVVAGGRMLVHFNNHHKTITSLSLCMQNKRIVSASLDR